jgi:beta-lactam-binding protein with PASTA domain
MGSRRSLLRRSWYDDIHVMRFGTRVWGIGKLLILIGALGVTYLLFFGIAMRVAVRAQEVAVPTLTGRSVNDATRMLTDLGLALRVDDNLRPDDKVPAGQIMRQDPAAGTQARRQRSVRVWVSGGPRSTPVPRLAGQTERTARLRLDQDGIETAAVSEIRSSDYPSDAVIAQDPAPDARAPRVALLVNRGEAPTTYLMPDVVNQDATMAADTLIARGFRVTLSATSVAGVAPGIVLRQRPDAGYPVTIADAVSLEVSK